jgi:hypothetical protein
MMGHHGVHASPIDTLLHHDGTDPAVPKAVSLIHYPVRPFFDAKDVCALADL